MQSWSVMPVVSYWAEPYTHLCPPSVSYLCVQTSSKMPPMTICPKELACFIVTLGFTEEYLMLVMPFFSPSHTAHVDQCSVLFSWLSGSWSYLPLCWAWGAELALKSSSILPANPQCLLAFTTSKISFISGSVTCHAVLLSVAAF